MHSRIVILLSLCFCFSLTANDKSNIVISQKSQQDIYQSKLECDNAFSTGAFQSCWLTLSLSNKPVEDVEIFIDGGMPVHEHGLQTSPKVVWSMDRNVYLIQGLKFSMPGEWELNFKVNASDTALQDQITMLFEVD